MRTGPSRTAIGVARRRAAHQVLDSPKVFDDPLAIAIAGGVPDVDETIAGRYLRAFIAVRSRFAEDQLAAAIARGVRQYVVLGAGLDTYAYRAPAGVRVFEVDHPATQQWKRERLREARIAIPAAMRFVPVDFERQRLGEELARAGFNAQEPAFFSWLGVVMYLTLEAATETVRFIGSLARGSGVAFDYASGAPELLTRRVARAGEPFTLFFEPAELDRILRELGFSQVENLNCGDINARYFTNRADGLCVAGDRGFLIAAWV